MMGYPDTLTQVINRLKSQGYTEDLNRHDNNALWGNPDAYRVDAVYRFEGPTSPDDESILYALSSDRYLVRGILVNGYGPSADPITATLEQQLHRWPT